MSVVETKEATAKMWRNYCDVCIEAYTFDFRPMPSSTSRSAELEDVPTKPKGNRRKSRSEPCGACNENVTNVTNTYLLCTTLQSSILIVYCSMARSKMTVLRCKVAVVGVYCPYPKIGFLHLMCIPSVSTSMVVYVGKILWLEPE